MNGWGMAAYLALLMSIALTARQGVLRFLTAHGVTGANYRNRTIPSATGVLIWLTSAAALLILKAGAPLTGDIGLAATAEYYECMFLAFTVVFCLGWTDDLIGDRKVKGLKGHIRALVSDGTVSTGLIKAAGTAAASLWIVFETGLWQGVLFGIPSLLTMILYTNALNLFDLRPGRAIKVFLLGCAVVIAVSMEDQGAWLMLIPAIAGACVLLPIDLKGQGMLGDTGANMLGFALGSTIALYWDWHWQAAAVFVLIGLTVLAERYSLTTLIERVPVLDWLDRLGRE